MCRWELFMNRYANQSTVKSIPLPQIGPVLYVTEAGSDTDDALEAVCDLADAKHGQIELIHVVDLAHVASKPDAHMGIQHRLEMLARKLKKVERNVVSVLLFGSPEDVISKRATEVRAKLIAFDSYSGSSPKARRGLIDRLMRRVSCPVVILSGKTSRTK
jgi:nucleotide-binding universal stress UspA family protein